MTSNEYERLAFERERLKDNYELLIQKRKLIADIKTDYKKEMDKVYAVKEAENKESKIKKFFKKLFKVL